MATFKVGDKVRIARDVVYGEDRYVGREGVIVGLGRHLGPEFGRPKWDCHVDIQHRKGPVNCMFVELEPRTPPAVDAWATEQVRKVTKPTPESIREREPARSPN